jgi:hypothetical protein
MPYYAFMLDDLNVKFQRGQIPDDDVVTFQVFVNQVVRAQHASTFTNIVSGTQLPVTRSTGIPADWGAFALGPIWVNDGDGITVVYTGSNVSDSPPDSFAPIEIKLLDALVTAVVSAAGIGLIGAAIGGALGAIGDPVGKFLGYKPQGPCNGSIFHDTVNFTGAGLAALPYAPLGASDYRISSFTRPYTDAETHNSDICGHIAETDVSFAVVSLPYISVSEWTMKNNPNNARFIRNGLRLFMPPGKTSVREAVGAVH